MDFTQVLDHTLVLVIQALLAALLGSGGVLMAYWQPRLKANYEKSVSVQDRALIEMVVRSGVTAAEQLWAQPQIQAAFQGKKALAIDLINKQLQDHRLSATSSYIDTLIESAVQQFTPKGDAAALIKSQVSPDAPSQGQPAGVVISNEDAQALSDVAKSLSDIVQKVPAPAIVSSDV